MPRSLSSDTIPIFKKGCHIAVLAFPTHRTVSLLKIASTSIPKPTPIQTTLRNMASKIPPHLHDATRRKIRGVIMTGSVAAITIVGTMTGAALRTDSDRKKVPPLFPPLLPPSPNPNFFLGRKLRTYADRKLCNSRKSKDAAK